MYVTYSIDKYLHIYYISTVLSRYYHLHQFLINPHWSTTSADIYPLNHNTQALMAQPVEALSRTHPKPTVCLLQDRDDRGLYNEWRGHAAVPAYPLNDRNTTVWEKKSLSERLILPPSGHAQQADYYYYYYIIIVKCIVKALKYKCIKKEIVKD